MRIYRPCSCECIKHRRSHRGQLGPKCSDELRSEVGAKGLHQASGAARAHGASQGGGGLGPQAAHDACRHAGAHGRHQLGCQLGAEVCHHVCSGGSQFAMIHYWWWLVVPCWLRLHPVYLMIPSRQGLSRARHGEQAHGEQAQ
jgi:hypothetical protein